MTGLFAIAFATALALGEKPELFLFNQPKMVPSGTYFSLNLDPPAMSMELIFR